MTRVLIADDIQQNLYLLESILKGNSYEVISAKNGAEALELAKKDPPDLIITDILMPVMDGFELCRRWKADEDLQHIPLIFYTATYTDPRDEQFAMGLGAEQYVIKPVKPDVLMGIVRDVLNEAEQSPPSSPEQTEQDEVRTLQEYNEIIFRKLQDKVLELEDQIVRCNQVEEELREKERFLDSIFEHIPNMVFVKDADDLRFIRFNKAGEDFLGLSREELIGKNDLDFFPQEQGLHFIEKDREALKKKKLVDIPEEPVLTRDKGERILHTRKIPILDEAGNPKYLLGISEDITERIDLENLRKTTLLQVEEQILQLAILNDSIRNPLTVIIGLSSMNEGEVFEQIVRQAYEIDEIVTRLDQGWLESMKIREFIRKHYP